LQSSSHRSSKAHRGSSSGGIAVTSASGQRGIVTSISHHDGYPNGGYTMEEYGDHSGGSSGGSSFERDQHIRSLESRLREVEQLLISQQSAAAATTPVARSARHHAQSQSRVPPSPMDGSALAEKDAEIAKLQRRLEQQQVQYEEEMRGLRNDTESVSGEHSAFKNKLARMERELEEYKEKAARADSTAISVAASEKIEEKETELCIVRTELERLKRDKENMERRQEQIEFLHKQNESLNEKLDEKEGDVKTLQEQLVTLRLEHSMYQQSCSSGSTPLADEETRSLVVGEVTRTPQSVHHGTGGGDSASVGGGGQLARVRQYTKAHSTLGASGIAITPSSSSASPSLSGTPKSSGLAKSLSNYHLDAAGTGRNELPPALSVMMRKTQKLSVDSRALAHCIKECAEKTMRGEMPDTNLLVGRMTGESMSDSSDCEMVATDCTKMSLETAEKTLRQQEVTLAKLHSSLEAMRGLLLQVYQRRFHDEMERGDESCRVHELAEYSRERGEESAEWRVHYKKAEEMDLPENVDERFERVKTVMSPEAMAALILTVSSDSTPFSHSNCLTRGSIAFAQISSRNLIDLPSEMCEVGGPILHELLHSLLIPHSKRGVMHDGRLPEGSCHNENLPVRCMGNIEAAILTHHPVILDVERTTDESPITAMRSDETTVVLSANVIYCVVVRDTVAERSIDWRGMEERERRVSRLGEADQLIVCSSFNVKCF
ncbi:hypothetical protein PMAYCL1PPCAC_29721, partial [Pristionchus mayeri]